MVEKIARASFSLSVVLGALGQLITFIPGAEIEWFALAAILVIPGFVIPKWSFRSASCVLLLLWSMSAFSGYTRGKEYEAYLKEGGAEKRFQEVTEQLKLTESN